jgi:hypothetical protein
MKGAGNQGGDLQRAGPTAACIGAPALAVHVIPGRSTCCKSSHLTITHLSSPRPLSSVCCLHRCLTFRSVGRSLCTKTDMKMSEVTRDGCCCDQVPNRLHSLLSTMGMPTYRLIPRQDSDSGTTPSQSRTCRYCALSSCNLFERVQVTPEKFRVHELAVKNAVKSDQIRGLVEQ